MLWQLFVHSLFAQVFTWKDQRGETPVQAWLRLAPPRLCRSWTGLSSSLCLQEVIVLLSTIPFLVSRQTFWHCTIMTWKGWHYLGRVDNRGGHTVAVFEKVDTCATLMISCDVHLFILSSLWYVFFCRRSCYLSNKKKAEKTALPKLLNLMIGGLTDHNNVFPVDLVLYSGSTFPSSPQRVS